MRSTPYLQVLQEYTRLTFNKQQQNFIIIKTMHMNFIPHMLKSITLLQEHYIIICHNITTIICVQRTYIHRKNNEILAISV